MVSVSKSEWNPVQWSFLKLPAVNDQRLRYAVRDRRHRSLARAINLQLPINDK